jgi:pantoate--beta-alanine ligase
MKDGAPGMSAPQLVTTLTELRNELGRLRRGGKRIGLVPTMGALHEGHLSLVRASQAECGFTVVTIYVNPSQFGPREDFSRYPRTLQRDLDLLAGSADLVFAPRDEEVYPPGYATWVEVGSVTEPLEGACRPGHFRGVATIVLKLLNMVGPDAAYFGQKDYQQALVIRRMASELNLPLTIRVCPIVREANGLALSSRNAYLSADQRRQAAVLSESLRLAAELVAQGERRASVVAARVQEAILSAGPAEIVYIALADPETLEPVETIRGRIVALLAVKIGKTRLIDNAILEPPS